MERSCRPCIYMDNPRCPGCKEYDEDENCKFENWKPEIKETVKTKPPLGVMPEKIWKLQRCLDLSRAIHEYLHCETIKFDLISNWISELGGLIKNLEADNNEGY